MGYSIEKYKINNIYIKQSRSILSLVLSSILQNQLNFNDNNNYLFSNLNYLKFKDENI